LLIHGSYASIVAPGGTVGEAAPGRTGLRGDQAAMITRKLIVPA
jgi:hypothetical protein